MKKLVTLRNVMLWAAGLLAIVAFILSFVVSVKLEMEAYGISIKATVLRIVWGSNAVEAGGEITKLTGDDVGKALVLPIVGYILALVAGLAAACLPCVGPKLFKDKKYADYTCFAIAGVLFISAIFVFLTKASYKSVNEIDADYMEYLSFSFISILNGIFMLLAAGAVAASRFVPDKKLLK